MQYACLSMYTYVKLNCRDYSKNSLNSINVRVYIIHCNDPVTFETQFTVLWSLIFTECWGLLKGPLNIVINCNDDRMEI